MKDDRHGRRFRKRRRCKEQIDATIEDAVALARGQLPKGESRTNCQACDAVIPEARRRAVPGVRLCIGCQEKQDKAAVPAGGYNRRGSKDSQLR